eukprot:13025001-Alexandrium_andersonii.AAC.1
MPAPEAPLHAESLDIALLHQRRCEELPRRLGVLRGPHPDWSMGHCRCFDPGGLAHRAPFAL